MTINLFLVQGLQGGNGDLSAVFVVPITGVEDIVHFSILHVFVYFMP